MQSACFSKISDIKAGISSLKQNRFSVYLTINWCLDSLLIFVSLPIHQFCINDFKCSIGNLNCDLYISCVYISRR